VCRDCADRESITVYCVEGMGVGGPRYICASVCVRVCVYVCVCVCTCVCISACMHACMYVFFIMNRY